MGGWGDAEHKHPGAQHEGWRACSRGAARLCSAGHQGPHSNLSKSASAPLTVRRCSSHLICGTAPWLRTCGWQAVAVQLGTFVSIVRQ